MTKQKKWTPCEAHTRNQLRCQRRDALECTVVWPDATPAKQRQARLCRERYRLSVKDTYMFCSVHRQQIARIAEVRTMSRNCRYVIQIGDGVFLSDAAWNWGESPPRTEQRTRYWICTDKHKAVVLLKQVALWCSDAQLRTL